ncbi:Uncharacterized protein T07_671 [Trichinella nelsoni]|uniref:Apple domain-containing protein n=5 Tax=Trichinella TaxID=6333 RepID=A0A0V1CBM7_TRIBR|nr:Uncharacterized protein T07_671 [Trichinella nelsoni]KRX39536.1 Uncharacterized protein T05_16087 [Trichinella murrelli]KRX64650.1 Uncharacterized protein T09_15366 [Trichinella sp. T9]KRX75284.1 Uncharacterized protein T06_2094 [Trichinella sp. T6]KRY09259.1 Uncharacterized protein T12_11957 [Trichinella patagoniensis]KRY46130.1 Uncharacterized protein T03_12715 [Trichinella britovi]KRZ60421.1 Uncharacterized protein T02_5897 [Trichinella nativa]KRZ89061.1 Uncharacterized protein T08_284
MIGPRIQRLALLALVYATPTTSESRIPDRQQDVYYDIFYDSSCPNGWKSNAVRDFIFVSRRAKMIPVSNPEACLRHCYMRTDCKSANLVKSKWKLDKQTLAKFNCHLNEQSQFDRPELLVPQKGVIYYDSIHCTTPDESI